MSEQVTKYQKLIDELKQMVLAEKKLNARLEDDYLLKFLVTCDFDCKNSFKMIQNYYKLREKTSVKHFSPNSTAMLRVWENEVFTILPKRDLNGRKILVHSTGRWDTDRCTFNDLIVAKQLCFEMEIKDEPPTERNEFIFVYNITNVGLNHARHLPPSNLIHLIRLVEDSFPAYFHQFHFINENAIIKGVYNLCLPIMSKSLREKVFFHGDNMQSLNQYVDLSLLPKGFGTSPEAIPVSNKDLLKKMQESEEYYQKLNSFGYIK